MFQSVESTDKGIRYRFWLWSDCRNQNHKVCSGTGKSPRTSCFKCICPCHIIEAITKMKEMLISV